MTRPGSKTSPARRRTNGKRPVRMGVPRGDWSRDELAARADMENDQITERQNDAAHYWFLGKALLPIRAEVADGLWEQFCEDREIERTRWQRAAVLAKAFRKPKELADLSIERAMTRARQILGIEPRQTPLEAKHRRRLKTMSEALQNSLEDLAGPDAAQPRVRVELLVAVDNAARLLRELRDAYTLAQRSPARRPGLPA